MMPFFGNVFPSCVWHDLFHKSEGICKSEGFFPELVGFFRRCGRLLAQMQKVLNFAATSVYVASYTCWFSWDRLTMAILSKYVEERIVSMKESGLTNHEVVETLKCEGATVIHVTMQVVRGCHKRYLETSIDRRKGSGRPTLCTGALLMLKKA